MTHIVNFEIPRVDTTQFRKNLTKNLEATFGSLRGISAPPKLFEIPRFANVKGAFGGQVFQNRKQGGLK